MLTLKHHCCRCEYWTSKSDGVVWLLLFATLNNARNFPDTQVPLWRYNYWTSLWLLILSETGFISNNKTRYHYFHVVIF